MIIRCWDTRVQSYPTSTSKIKSINCSAWPFLYFLFTADGWNFCDTFLSSWTKSTFFIFQILIRYSDTGVQSYLTSACKIFGVGRKRRVPAEKWFYRSTSKKTLMCLKQKDWSKGGSSYLNQVSWSPQQTIPDHRLYLSIQLQKLLSRTYSRFLYMSLCAWVSVCVWVCLCVCVFM